MPVMPDEKVAADVVSSMTNETVVSSARMTTGDQHFVFAVTTESTEYVLRMTLEKYRKTFLSSIYWQDKFLPVGVPLAKFIQTDMDGKFSPFPSLLMRRFLGNDLINVYSDLSTADKENLAKEIIDIQAKATKLPVGQSYGIIDRYENNTGFKSWYEFLVQRLELFRGLIQNNGVFDPNDVDVALSIVAGMKQDLCSIAATPFLWDASERNVIVNHGKISGIVDVDEICFGDPLFVIGLTAVALENEGYDTEYTDFWAQNMHLDSLALRRLNFYKLFYTITFMRKHAMMTANKQQVNFNVQRLKNMFMRSVARMKY